MKDKYDLIIFDWDGTLMDSEAKIVRCFEQAVYDVGLAYPGADAVRQIIGLGLKEAIDRLMPAISVAEAEQLAERYRQHFLFLDETTMAFFPEVEQGLKQLESFGYMMAVATGKARRGLARLLKENDMEQQFVATRCADEAFSKPHPKMLEDLLGQTGIEAGRAIMIGDTTFDMEMAINAGTDCLAVSYGVHDKQALLQYTPVDCLDSFAEVRDWLMRNDQ